MLGMALRASHTLVRSYTTEPHLQAGPHTFIVRQEFSLESRLAGTVGVIHIGIKLTAIPLHLF